MNNMYDYVPLGTGDSNNLTIESEAEFNVPTQCLDYAVK